MDQSDTANPATSYDLDRFRSAQEKDLATAIAEIKAGHKESHWIWFIFPQLRGIGHSSMSRYYAIEDLEEAVAYLEDPYLCGNLIAVSQALLDQEQNDASEIFGWPDDLKVKSCMTLFEQAAEELSRDAGRPAQAPAHDFGVFRRVLERFYEGRADTITLELLEELAEEKRSLA